MNNLPRWLNRQSNQHFQIVWLLPSNRKVFDRGKYLVIGIDFTVVGYSEMEANDSSTETGFLGAVDLPIDTNYLSRDCKIKSNHDYIFLMFIFIYKIMRL